MNLGQAMREQSYVEEIRQYQEQMDQQLRAPDGWLTLVGLHWLKEGKNTIGSALACAVLLPPYSAPQEVGDLVLENGQVTFQARSGVAARVNGQPVREKTELESDLNRNPTVITLGDLSFFVIIRGDRVGIRVKQASSPRRLNFPGRIWWPADEGFRVQANVKVYDSPKPVQITDILGDTTEAKVEQALQFTLDGQTYKLDAFGLPSGQFYIQFHDLSCGQGSYPAGRNLITEIPDLNTVVIDFNKAYNPPCGFTPFATCPLPLKQNYLNTQIRAGERYQNQDGEKEK